LNKLVNLSYRHVGGNSWSKENKIIHVEEPKEHDPNLMRIVCTKNGKTIMQLLLIILV